MLITRHQSAGSTPNHRRPEPLVREMGGSLPFWCSAANRAERCSGQAQGPVSRVIMAKLDLLEKTRNLIRVLCVLCVLCVVGLFSVVEGPVPCLDSMSGPRTPGPPVGPALAQWDAG
jgi:hypothetical protein